MMDSPESTANARAVWKIARCATLTRLSAMNARQTSSDRALLLANLNAMTISEITAEFARPVTILTAKPAITKRVFALLV